VFNDQGELIHFVGVKEDFTERKEIELALVEARETAERANRAKSDFLSSMSHELRTPMNAILGFAQVLDMDDRLHADQRDFVGEILKGGHHLLELINDVLELSRIESGKVHLSLEALELADVVDECRALILPLADARRLTLAVALPASATLRGDRVRLKQSLLNLLSNAVKYNREGGEIRLAATPAGAGRLRVTVSDSGHGIAPERMHELFQPFSRLGAEQGSIEGTGIGLNITRRLVELMGGKVGAESTPNLGSEFWIELPLADAPTAEAPRRPVPPAPSAPGAGESRGVLCIDDNPINLRLVARMLEIHRPLRLRTAHSATLGIELARAEPPDLILLDINMPGMDGFQALEILRGDARLRHVPVIAITANAMPRDIARGTAAGFDAYLTKPLNHALLVAEVDRFLAPVTRASP
jgi:CheY-like chemotaxis protein/two-component sensor histidine kinase